MSVDCAFLKCFGGIDNNSLNNILQGDDKTDDIQIEIIEHSAYYNVDMLYPTLNEKKNCFNILSTNIESINAKFNELELFVYELQENGLAFSAICIQESWLDDNCDLSQYQLDGYECISQGKSCSSKGGLIIYLRNNFKYKYIKKINESNIWEGQFIEINGGGLSKNIVLANVYRPPRDLVENYKIFTEELTQSTMMFDNDKTEMIITGDTNINLLKINEREIFSEFFDSLTSQSLYPKITMPTRFSNRSGTLIDNFFAKLSPATYGAKCGILTKKFSDHQPYFMCLNTPLKEEIRIKFIKIKNNSPINITKFKDGLKSSIKLKEIKHNVNTNPNISYNILCTEISKNMEKHMPDKLVKFNKHKHKRSRWITRGIIKSVAFRDKMRFKLKATNQDTPEYQVLKVNLSTYNNILKRNIRLAKQTYYETCFNKYKNDIRKTWMTINDILRRGKKNKSFPDFFKADGQNITDKLKIANQFNVYFTNIGPNLAGKITTPQNKSYKNYLKNKQNLNFKLKNIDKKVVSEIIDNIQPKTSSGNDKMSMKLVKDIKDILLEPLTIIANQILTTGIFPDELKIAKVIPLFKANDNTLFSNYRPISLLPALSKIFEKIIYAQLFEYFQNNGLFYKSQYGFRSGHSTELAALEVIDRVVQSMDKGDIPINIYLDLSKAFDTLDHDILLDKLDHYGVKGTGHKLIKSYLQDRKQYVDIDGTKSDILPITTGVPQGSVLGPLLFIIYMNDIEGVSHLFNAILYADDTTLSSTLTAFNINPREYLNGEAINNELEKINLWLKLNKLSLNVEKSKFVIFHMPQKIIPPLKISIDGIEIQRVENFNFLGIILNENINWSTHVSHVSNKISRTIGILNKLKNILPENIKLVLYNSLILPHINYGILSWGFKHERILKLQKKATRIITLSKYNAHTEPLFKYLKLIKVTDIKRVQELKFYYKYKHNKLPGYFLSMRLNTNREIHPYGTRNQTNIHVIRTNHEFAKKCLRQNLIGTINETKENILGKIESHSLQGFGTYVKNTIIKGYSETCQIQNCYICNKYS